MSDRRILQHAPPLSRRDFLKLGGVVGSASVLAACGVNPEQGTPAITTSAGQIAPTLSSVSAGDTAHHSDDVVLRIAHISDMHVEPGSPGVKGFQRALRHVEALSPAVDIVVNTGDCVMDSLKSTRDRAEQQWGAFNAVLKAECSLPVYHAIGNHDVWGWGLSSNEQDQARTDPLFGKALALAQLGLESRYYSFDQGGWRFLVLDSTHVPDISQGIPYTGKLDEPQVEWLELQLDATPSSMPVCVVSHIPILAACEYLDGDNESSGNWIVPGAFVHIDARRLWTLFWQHPNVRLCLSGHTHQVEDLRYHGVKYLTEGAISANWWNGPYFDFQPGYAVVTLYQDGSSESQFIAY